MADFDNFLQEVAEGIKELVEATLKDFKKEALKDGQTFLNSTKADLERWTRLLARGELTRQDFEWLVQGKKDLAEMKLLKQRGLAQIKINKFTNSLIALVIDKALSMVA